MERQRMITAGLRILSYRTVAFLAVLFLAGAFLWTLLDPTLMRLITAGVFGVFDSYFFTWAILAGRQT